MGFWKLSDSNCVFVIGSNVVNAMVNAVVAEIQKEAVAVVVAPAFAAGAKRAEAAPIPFMRIMWPMLF